MDLQVLEFFDWIWLIKEIVFLSITVITQVKENCKWIVILLLKSV